MLPFQVRQIRGLWNSDFGIYGYVYSIANLTYIIKHKQNIHQQSLFSCVTFKMTSKIQNRGWHCP